MRKFIFAVAAALSCPLFLSAQDTTAVSADIDPKLNIMLDARLDAQAKTTFKDKGTDVGFGGRFITLIIDGTITDRLTYAYRQRLFVAPTVREFFNATDWLYLKYRFHDNMYMSAGKEVINVGGYEYDANPIDDYFHSAFYDGLTGAYNVGMTLGVLSNDERHTVKFQVTNSPFSEKAYDGRFAYNILWTGKMGCFTSLYSINAIETHRKGHFLNYIALGNRFEFGQFRIDLDYTNRYAIGERQNGFLSDFSVNCNVLWSVTERLNLFVKGGYDQNLGQAEPEDASNDSIYDIMVRPGTKYAFYGLGMEFFPIKGKKDLRIHAFCASDNTSPVPYTFNVGVRWRMKLFSRQ